MEVWDQNLAILIALTSYIAFTAVFCYCTSHDWWSYCFTFLPSVKCLL